jgi:hypothetical protein
MTLHFGISDDTVSWSVSGLPNTAVGHSVTLELNGVGVANASVAANGCVSSTVTLCLDPGLYTGVAVSQGFADSNAVAYDLTAQPSCANPVGPNLSSGSSGATGAVASPSSSTGTSSGALAFTGANVLKWLLAAGALVLLGMAVTRSTRKRRHAR